MTTRSPDPDSVNINFGFFRRLGGYSRICSTPGKHLHSKGRGGNSDNRARLHADKFWQNRSVGHSDYAGFELDRFVHSGRPLEIVISLDCRRPPVWGGRDFEWRLRILDAGQTGERKAGTVTYSRRFSHRCWWISAFRPGSGNPGGENARRPRLPARELVGRIGGGACSLGGLGNHTDVAQAVGFQVLRRQNILEKL